MSPKQGGAKFTCGVVKRKFNKLEDATILQMYAHLGKKCWKTVGKMLNRNPRTCRERYRNYLSQKIETKPWSQEEDQILREKYSLFGPRWIEIAHYLPGRTDINIKNRWALLLRHKAKEELREETMKNQSDCPSCDSVQEESVPQQTAEPSIFGIDSDPFGFLQINYTDELSFDFFD